jgi:transketolase
MPMGMADIAEVLWNNFLRHNPGNPTWTNRDRFILSNGHGSMLHYALLHLSGYDLSIDDIKQFRQLHSKTPGHPEYGYTPGIETTTGPLGQGLANAVGMALAERILAARFNQPGHNIVDHYTYVLVGDGCLMEGLSHEVCSLAGTLGLGKLIAIYDDNGISIDGETANWFTDDTAERFRAYGWHVVPGVDGHDAEAVGAAIRSAHDESERPSLLCCKTIIGWGSPNKQGKASSHGAALGEAEIALVREQIGWPHAPFEVPAEIYTAWDARSVGAAAEAEWSQSYSVYAAEYPQLAAEFERRMQRRLPDDWAQHADDVVRRADAETQSPATRKASQMMLNQYGPVLPELIGGSADLTGSNLTMWEESNAITRSDSAGNYVYYGVREFGMFAVMNGIALHGGFIPYGGTFLIFSEYGRNALRMAALMGTPSIFVFTHDSIGLGEDGPTHQAVEQAATLRLIPNMSVWRPCDTTETAVAWRVAIERDDGPTCLLLSRQGLPFQARSAAQIDAIGRGGYTLQDCNGTPEAIIIATGSEVGLAMVAASELTNQGRRVRVVSMPSTDAFDRQDSDYQETVLPNAVTARVAVEAGVRDLWFKYVGLHGRVVGIDSFGESAPAEAVFEHFGFSAERVAAAVNDVISA